MTLHKLAAGSGYTYLTKQVAAHDATERRQVGLASYYEEKGEAPGRWLGTGLAGLDLTAGNVVTEEQMKLLFGQGRHPRSGEPGAAAKGWGALGRAFPTFGATTLRQVTARALSEHNTDRGLAWNAPIPAEERARIRTEVARAVFEQRHGRAPADEAELTRFLAKASRPEQVPVAGFDLTFSPVKSVSALWALASPEVAREVEAAHEDAVRATLALLEKEVAFTRVGKGGIRQVPVVGLVAAAFDHRDSRTGDPDLHTHVVVSNKVQSLPEEGGRWLTLDGRMLFKAKVMASEHYNTHLEAGLVDRLGVRFVDRPSPEGKRAVREIDGIDPALLTAWSSRRQAIEARQRELAAAFLANHGRTPTTIESLALAQQANLETRPGKHEPRSEGEQRAAWREQATAVLARDERSPEGMVASAVGARWGRDRGRGGEAGMVAGQRVGTRPGHLRVHAGGGVRPQVVAVRVLSVLEGSRATWQVWHVRAETLRQLRTAQVPLSRLEAYQRDVERWVLQGFSVPVGVPPELGEPEVLRRPDGQSAHVVHGSQAYTSKAILAAEEELLSSGLRRDGRQAAPTVVETVLAGQSGDGPGLDRSQAAMVRSLASSGCRVQVALAPAGAGKTAALRVLARAWVASGGTVLGLAPTAVAAEELGRATTIPADTIAKYLHQTTTGAAHGVQNLTGGANSRVGPGTMVLIDEAGMAGTRDLAAVVRHVVEAGGSVRLVGDDQQLAAVAAGGIFRDVAEQGHAHGTTATLTEVHRFTDPAEGAATLAIRDGVPAALDHYLDHGRVHGGDTGDVVEAAYAAWAADKQAGLSSLLLAATRVTVRELNQRARQDRLDTTGQPPGREVGLDEGTRASAGDTIVTRRNDRSLRAGDGSWVKNGDRWSILAVHPDGAVSVERHRDGRGSKLARVILPAGYVSEHIQLGYASTIHGAQGATVDTTHTVLTGTETRQGLYVALSRGRQANHLYVTTPTTSLDGVGPEVQDTSVDPRQVLTDILARDGRALSATTIERGDAALLLREAVLSYQDALPVLAQQHLGRERMAALDDALEDWLPGLTGAPAYPHLRGQLAVRWVDGTAPRAVIEEATWYRGRDSLLEAEDPAAALAWRIAGATPPSHRDAPLPWLPDVPPAIRQDTESSDYLDRLTFRIEQLVGRVADGALQAGASDRMVWQRPLPADVDDQLIGDLAVWRAAHAIPPTEPTPTGAPMRDPAAARHQTLLTRRLTAATATSPRPTADAASRRLRAAQRHQEQDRHQARPAPDLFGPAL
ncbi:MobF family relaxase [Ornithinimicrobium cerasi]|uniref:Conjugative relaxase domain-containing protein, TrwC/TraI family n=1 Tax=Ornithinimicrobium cerasi TaxID=2248773 RepID=A0A285VVQ8_9MICO|nr:MobF family relaxase [Ornithinimicrobium cerasi]SOC58170.1 conjugative relaxase domain-containing protein, TrwC/TraI family [Ornithinimicrobium cerasi]